MGASGCWSFETWMGPWPILRIYQACVDGDAATARRVTSEVMSGGSRRPADGTAEGGDGVNPQAFAGYIDPGAPRAPFTFGPQRDAEAVRKRADHWVSLCEKYKPDVEAWRAAH
jgi:hypothetical protein